MKDIVVLDRNFKRLGLLENATVIWTSRFYESGEFEIYVSNTLNNLNLIMQGQFVARDDDKDNIGVIDDLELNSDTKDGDKITIKGKFALGHILNKRIISQQTQLSGNVQTQLRNLVYDNIVNPTDAKRKIDFVKLGAIDETISEKIDLQATGNNLLEKTSEICKEKNIGMKMPLKKGTLYYEVYKGIDRSYAQHERPHVIFSEEYDNLGKATYKITQSELKNVAYVAGEGEGVDRKIVTTYSGETEPTGFDRAEVWVDQRNISSNEENITEAEIESQMIEEGKESLAEPIEVFDGEVFLYGLKYGKPEDGGDCFLGDVVTVKKAKWNGMYINARIIEVVESKDSNGEVITIGFGV